MIDVIPFVTLTEANEYFSTRLHSENWDQANNDKRLRAIIESTRLINNLNFVGTSFSINQHTVFPRYIGFQLYSTIPEEIKIACLEVVYALLDDTLDMELEIDGLSDYSTGFASVKSDKNVNIYHEHIRAGIPSYRAWQYLKPFLNDPRNITLKRY